MKTISHQIIEGRSVAEGTGGLRSLPASLDRSVGEECDAALVDIMAGTAARTDEQVEVLLVEEALHREVAELPDREQQVVKLRFGLIGDEDPKSLEEIGRRMGITRERVRQIQSTALKRLARRCELEETAA